jgi:hypothetical protein
MGAAPAIAKPADIQAVLDPSEVEIVSACLAVSRPKEWWRRFLLGFSAAMKATTLDEFRAVCEAAVKLVDGQALTPGETAYKAQRIVTAATSADSFAICAKCDTTDTAVLTIMLGGFRFNRAIKLKDPKGARRG